MGSSTHLVLMTLASTLCPGDPVGSMFAELGCMGWLSPHGLQVLTSLWRDLTRSL